MLAAAGVLLLSGCATTQQEAARVQLNDARIRASQVPTRVTTPGQAVRVLGVTLVRDGRGGAFVVTLHNDGRRTVSDLPISVGVRLRSRRTVYVNLESPQEYSYFDAHLAAVAPGATVTWVYTDGSRLPRRAVPFATVGGAASPPDSPSSRLPLIRAAVRGTGPGVVQVALRNLSGITQYQLQVYAFAQEGGRYVAAGSLTLPELGPQERRTVEVSLLGRATAAPLEVEALPTIFQ